MSSAKLAAVLSRPQCVKMSFWTDTLYCNSPTLARHDDAIKWKHYPFYWPFLWGIHRPTVNSPHKGEWSGALMLSLICASTNSWANNGEAGVLRHHCAHYHVIVMGFNTDSGTITPMPLKKPRTIWVNHIFSPSIIMRLKQNKAQHNRL